MGHAIQSMDEIRLVCDDPRCMLRTGAYGLTTRELVAKITVVRGRRPPLEGEDAKPSLPSSAVPPEVAAIDPTNEGAPCPACAEANPPRDGKLLALPAGGEQLGALAAAAGLRGLGMWQAVESAGAGTFRAIEALAKLSDDTPRPKGIRVGGRAITAVVLRALPFDGRLLQIGNQDQWTRRAGKGSKFTSGTATYGLPGELASDSVRETPAYVRELQADLLWLGYFSPSRGSPPVGIFDENLLGAVLAFKQDLVEIYGVEVSATRVTIPAGSIDPGKFDAPIHYQRTFLSPVRIMLDWSDVLSGEDGVLPKVQSLARKLGKPLKKAKTPAAFSAALRPIKTLIEQLAWWSDNWSHRAVFEDLGRAFTPFEPRKPAEDVGELPSADGLSPKHADAASLSKDGVWGRTDMGARPKNASAFATDRKELFADLARTESALGDASAAAAAVVVPAGAEAEWGAAHDDLIVALTRIAKLVSLTRFWVLDSPRQVEAWLQHVRDVGAVDTATAVYLKALREGGRIGPRRRPAYQLFENPDDLPSGDAGAVFIRDNCTKRPENHEGKHAATMPESIALQFFFNESGGRFARQAAPYAVDTKDKRRIPLMGTDTNSYRRGTFDAVFHKGGEWYTSRGWGIGQATEADAEIDGIKLVRGLPIMPPEATEIQHPRSFTDFNASFDEAFEGKVLAKYNRRTERRDCSYGRILGGHHYDCQQCLVRFFKLGLAGDPEKYGRGGIFVPTGAGSFGELRGATGFFVDLERYTKFARADGGTEADTADVLWAQLFDTPFTPAPTHVAETLRRGPSVAASASAVAEEHEMDPKIVAADVRAHIDRRSEFPCSWMRVRILYAGSGPQAFESLYDLLKVVGAGGGKEILQKHIAAASLFRRGGSP